MKAGVEMYSRLILAGAVLSMLGACNESEEPTDKVVATQNVSRLQDWLNVHDKIDPALWLRSREMGHFVSFSDPEVGRLRRALTQAANRFYEDQRMIANRTAQTGAMLAEAGKPEPYVNIVTALVDIADASSARKLYGQMCQHYLNVRKDGHDRSATIAQLSSAYKSAGSLSLKDKIP